MMSYKQFFTFLFVVTSLSVNSSSLFASTRAFKRRRAIAPDTMRVILKNKKDFILDKKRDDLAIEKLVSWTGTNYQNLAENIIGTKIRSTEHAETFVATLFLAALKLRNNHSETLLPSEQRMSFWYHLKQLLSYLRSDFGTVVKRNNEKREVLWLIFLVHRIRYIQDFFFEDTAKLKETEGA